MNRDDTVEYDPDYREDVLDRMSKKIPVDRSEKYRGWLLSLLIHTVVFGAGIFRGADWEEPRGSGPCSC